MLSKRGFSIVELFIMVLVLGLVAAVAVPLMRGRVDAAKWAEGRTMAEDLAGAMRNYAQSKGGQGSYGEGQPSLSEMGMSTEDLAGRYFDYTNFTWKTKHTESGNPPLDFSITVTAPEGMSPSTMTLSSMNVWSKQQ